MRAILTLLALLLIAAPAVAQDNMTDDAMDDAMDGHMDDMADDDFDVMPFVVLAAFAAVAFLLAKYGP